jgi:hypothetical protein
MKSRFVLIVCILSVSILACGLLSAPAGPPESGFPAERVDATAVVATFVAGQTEAAGAGGEAPAPEAPEVLPETALPRLAVLGQADHVRSALRELSQMGDFIITENSGAEIADLVLFAVAYPDGPMQPTREGILGLAGSTIARAAIIGTDLDGLNGDMELKELVDREMRELLSEVLPAYVAYALPILVPPGEDASTQLQELLDGPAAGIAFEIQAPTAIPGPALPRLAVIGHVDHLGRAVQQLSHMGDFTITENSEAETADLVLFVLSFLDGPMPQTREEILNLQGATIARAVILYIDADQMYDAELQQLVDLEMRELLAGIMPAEVANGLPGLILPDPGVSAVLQEILAYPTDGILLEP